MDIFPPSNTSTAFLILRGVVSGVTGCPIGTLDGLGETSPSLMQPSYIKDKYPSGKFSVKLGKKCGSACALTIPVDKLGREKLLDAIERAANRVIDANIPVQTFLFTKDELIDKYGHICFNQYELKDLKYSKKSLLISKGKKITVAYIKNTILAVSPVPVFASTGMIEKIVIEKRPDESLSKILSGKKARKCEIVIKFRVFDKLMNEDNVLKESVPEDNENAPDLSMLEPLLSKKVRMEKGTIFPMIIDDSKHYTDSVSTIIHHTSELTLDRKSGACTNDKTRITNNIDHVEEAIVNAFEVVGKVDYKNLVENFGSKLIDAELLSRFEALTVGRGTVPYLHRFLRRGLFFSHRDLHKICDCLELKKPLYLYTGRGPSSSAMHLGHLVPFLFTLWLQQALQCPVVIQMTDDEKFLFKGIYSDEKGDNLNNFAELTVENVRDIIACGFDPDKTFIFSDLNYVGTMYPNVVRIWKAVTAATVNNVFGFDGTSNIGKVAFPAIQAAPSFPSSFPTVLNADLTSNMACLIPCAIDQDPYFRITRDIAHKLTPKSHPLRGKPALIFSKFFPPLKGSDGKMSSSDETSAIFLTDTPEMIEQKIREHAFSGGKETSKLQRELGADLDVDVSFQWLRFFLEDDKELKCIENDYRTGTGFYWSTGSVKKKLINILVEFITEHKKRRENVTDDIIQKWMKERCLV